MSDYLQMKYPQLGDVQWKRHLHTFTNPRFKQQKMETYIESVDTLGLTGLFPKWMVNPLLRLLGLIRITRHLVSDWDLWM